jgi:hypothetical protein
MTHKPHQPQIIPPSTEKLGHKIRKGTTETSRLFINVDQAIRRPMTAPLSRYVE